MHLHIRESCLTQSSSVSGVCAETEAGGGKGDPGSDHPLPLQPDQGHPGATGECGDQSEASIMNINQSEASIINIFQSEASI